MDARTAREKSQRILGGLGVESGSGLAKPGFLVLFGFLVFWFNHGFIRISPQTLIKPNLENARETAETAGNGRNGRRRSAQSTFELEPRARILMRIVCQLLVCPSIVCQLAQKRMRNG